MDYDFEWEFITDVLYALNIASGQSFGKQGLKDILAILNTKDFVKVNMAVPFFANDARNCIQTLLDSMSATANIRFDRAARLVIIEKTNNPVDVLCDLRDLVLDALLEIDLAKKYRALCVHYSDFGSSENFKIDDQKSIIRRLDTGFKYSSRDRIFLKESTLEEYSIRMFIPAKSPIVDFSYMIWDDSIYSAPYLKGSITSLVEILEPDFGKTVKYKRPIAASLIEYDAILTAYFTMLSAFFRYIEETGVKRQEIIDLIKQEIQAT